ncbi:OsmC family protein [Egicoccus sp. AB-alg6-2]|uniref:OsmC family protein n=1 Tax=Egicoccus sp. AB-alg6-2 TaxID=3242692 RepID=UPI00359E8EFC
MTVRVEDADARSEPIIRGKSLTAVNEATLRTVIDTGEFGTFVTDEPVPHGGTGEGPSPLQTVLGALCGCEGVTFKRAADDLGLDYEGIEFEASYTIDIRGRKGDRTVRPHFQTIKVVARVFTAASQEDLRAVVEETEARCPVLSLVRDAGVDVTMVWQREPV